ncbi:MAG: DUF4843 domain-containing protein [Bacteroidales bacterium]|nr:DUF4843 domain-containing protein [Bacteroidales bacterium]
MEINTLYNKFKSIWLFVTASIMLSSCQEKVVNKFDSESSLFFYNGASNSKGITQQDSISYSFFLANSTLVQDTTWLDIYLTGMPSDEERSISIVQTNVGKPGAAVSGIHFVPFNDPGLVSKLVLPANKVMVSIPVVVKKTAEMESQEFRLDLAIIPNESFVEGIKDNTAYTIKITAMAVKPPLWDVANSFLSMFGTWGQVKMKFIIDNVGYSEFDVIPNVDYRMFLRVKAKEKLAVYEAANGPLYELDGVTRVIFP